MRILIGTEGGLRQLGAREREDFPGHEITALAPAGARVWLLLDGRELWQGDGDDWARVAPVDGPAATSLLVAGERVWVGTEEAHLLRLEGDRLARVESFDRAPGREAWYTPWGDPAAVRSLAADRSGALHVNVHVGGVARSTDAGATWEPTLDIETDVHQVLAHPARSGVVLAAAAVGFVVSRDGGDHWQTETAGLHAPYARAVAVADTTVLLSASSGPRGRRAALYRRALDGEAAFARCREGLPEWFPSNIDTACLAAAGASAAFGTDGGEVYVTEDAGVTWQRLAKDLPPVRGVALA